MHMMINHSPIFQRVYESSICYFSFTLMKKKKKLNNMTVQFFLINGTRFNEFHNSNKIFKFVNRNMLLGDNRD